MKKDVGTPSGGCDPRALATPVRQEPPATPPAPELPDWRPYVDWQHELVVVGFGLSVLGIMTLLLLLWEL